MFSYTGGLNVAASSKGASCRTSTNGDCSSLIDGVDLFFYTLNDPIGKWIKLELGQQRTLGLLRILLEKIEYSPNSLREMTISFDGEIEQQV